MKIRVVVVSWLQTNKTGYSPVNAFSLSPVVASVGPGLIPLAWRAFWQVSHLLICLQYIGSRGHLRYRGSPSAIHRVGKIAILRVRA